MQSDLKLTLDSKISQPPNYNYTKSTLSHVLGELLEEVVYGKRSHEPIDERDIGNDPCHHAIQRYTVLTERERGCLHAFQESMREYRRMKNVLRVISGMGALEYTP